MLVKRRVSSLRLALEGRPVRMRKGGVARLCGVSALRTGMESGHRQRVAVDCSLGHHMTLNKELMSLAAQISCAYAANLRAPRPFQLYLTGLETGGRIHRTLHTRISDFSSYQIEMTERLHQSVFNPQDTVYLTPDSSTDLEEMDCSKVYVIGGIVDLSINKRLTQHRAKLAGLSTARLPIKHYMEISTSTVPHSLNLPLNIVIDILLDVHSGKDWPHALLAHVPRRKGFQLKPVADNNDDLDTITNSANSHYIIKDRG